MKNNLIIKLFFLAATFVCAEQLQAQDQKKPSDRNFQEELKKIKEKQAERKVFLMQMQDQKINSSETNQDIFNPAKSSVLNFQINTKPVIQVNQIERTKPSETPMRKPVKLARPDSQ